MCCSTQSVLHEFVQVRSVQICHQTINPTSVCAGVRVHCSLLPCHRCIADVTVTFVHVLQASTWLIGTRKVYHDELTRDVRLLTLLRVAFFSAGKQAALGNLTCYLATLLSRISKLPPPVNAIEDSGQNLLADSSSEDPHLSNLLRYVPVVYVEAIVDYLTALRRCDEHSVTFGGAGCHEVSAAGSQSYMAWLCGSLNDPRIANPDVQESLLQVSG